MRVAQADFSNGICGTRRLVRLSGHSCVQASLAQAGEAGSSSQLHLPKALGEQGPVVATIGD